MSGFECKFIKHAGCDPWVVDAEIYDRIAHGGPSQSGLGVGESEAALSKFKGAVLENLEWKSKIGGSVVVADDKENPVVIPAAEVLMDIKR